MLVYIAIHPVQCPETKVSCQNLEGLCDAVNEEVTFPPTLAGYTATSTNSCAVDTESGDYDFTCDQLSKG